MMVETAVVLTLASVGTEFILVKNIKPVAKFLTESKYSPIASLFVSLGISWALGQLFGASGLIVLIASLVSTLISWVTYGSIKQIKIVRVKTLGSSTAVATA